VFVLADLVALTDLVARHFLVGLGVHLLVADAIAGLLVHLPERDLFGTRRCRGEGDRTGNQRELEVTLPVRTRCHGTLLLDRTREDRRRVCPRVPLSQEKAGRFTIRSGPLVEMWLRQIPAIRRFEA